MISWIHIAFLIAAFCGLVQTHSVSLAQTASDEKTQQCITQMNERTAALVAEDWHQLERLAKQYLQNCKGVFGTENLSNAYEHIAIANKELNNTKAALEASETCIDVYYANAGCHVLRVEALISLGRLSEARDGFKIAKRLIAHLIEVNQSHLDKASYLRERELYSSKIKELRALELFLNNLRSKL